MINDITKSFVIIFATMIIGALVFSHGIYGLIQGESHHAAHYKEGQMVICNTPQELSMYEVIKDTGRFIITSDDGIYEKKDCELARDVEN